MLRFRMVRINVEQFAILAHDVPAGNITIDTNIGVKASVADRKIALEIQFDFSSVTENVLILKQLCEFEIHEEDWATLQTEGKVTIPKELIEYFVVQTVGTARGILHCKTEGTPFNHLILPPLNAAEMIEHDVVIE